MEMLEHSNRRSRLSFFNIEMMETLRHRESTRDDRRGDCLRGRRASPEAAVLLSGGYPLREKLGGSEQGKANDRRGAACMAARKTSGLKARPIFLPIYRQPDACDLACGAGRSASPMPPSRPKSPIPPLRRAGVVGILCAGGFPAPGAPGARIIPNSPPRRAEARKAGRPAARGTAGKNFLKKVLDTAERAR